MLAIRASFSSGVGTFVCRTLHNAVIQWPAINPSSTHICCVTSYTADRNVTPDTRRWMSLGPAGITTTVPSSTELVLHNAGFEKDMVDSMLSSKPHLRRNSPQQTGKCLQILQEYGFTISHVKEIVFAIPDILSVPSGTLRDTIELWRGFRLEEKDVLNVFLRHPRLFLVQPEYISKQMVRISSKFSQRQVLKLLKNYPEVMMVPWSSSEEVFEYVKEQMGLEESDLVKSGALKYDVEYIKMRHEFVKRTGIYKTPSHKMKKASLNNPSLKSIVGESDRDIAKLAGLSVEEYRTFCLLLEKEEGCSKRNRHSDDVDDFEENVFSNW